MEQDQHRKVLKFLRMQKEHRENRGNPEQMLQKLSFLSAECCKLPWNIQEVFAAEFQVFFSYWRGLVFQKHTESRHNLLLKNWVLYGPLYRCKPCKASPWPVLPSLILELCLGVTLRDEHWISHNTASQDNVFKMLWGSSQQCWGLIFFFLNFIFQYSGLTPICHEKAPSFQALILRMAATAQGSRNGHGPSQLLSVALCIWSRLPTDKLP